MKPALHSGFGEPGVDAAGDVFDVGEAVGGEQLDGFGGTAAGFAVDEDFAVLGQAGKAVGEGGEGDELRLRNAGGGVFVGLADVDEKGVETLGEALAEFLCGDGLHGGIVGLAGG